MAEQLENQKRVRAKIKRNPLAESQQYENEHVFKTNGVPSDAKNVRTTAEMIAFCDHNKDVAIDAQVLCSEKSTGRVFIGALDRKSFLETFKANNRLSTTNKFKESLDNFARDGVQQGLAGSHIVGKDFIPLLGGPFYKNLYYYNDYLQMIGEAFYAFHHDPMARAIVNVTRQFVLGRGFRVDVQCDDKTQEAGAQALWDTFAEVNNLDTMLGNLCDELCIYGEDMIWWLPDNETKIQYNLRHGQEAPKGMIPRVRLVDPSNIIEVVTFPEDIDRVLHYTWLAPTQYQIYTGADGGNVVPSTKFIYRHIPADQMMHIRINRVSNEKRGRSDFYPVLGYMKRLRDVVNYSVITEMKNAAWAIDTVIEGDQTDIDNYIASQENIAPAGSEFVHTKAVERKYLSNGSGSKAASESFSWCLSMIAAGSGIPIQYLNVHLHGGSTRATALVATEPVAKKFEERQLILERVLKDMSKRLFKKFGVAAEIEVTWPDITTSDRSAKLKDLVLADQANYISHERASTIAAKELGVSEYVYEAEMEKVKAEQASGEDMLSPMSPLTTPGQPIAQKPPQSAGGQSPNYTPYQGSDVRGVTSQDKRDAKQNEQI